MASRVSSPVLVGRAHELDHLRTALAAVRDGAGRTVLLGGEAGVGKTRLVTEFAREAGAAGATVLAGGCVILAEGALPYAPIAEALRGMARHVGPDALDAVLGGGRAELARLVPDLGQGSGAVAVPLDGTSRDWGQSRLFELLLGVLERLAADHPVVLVVEDLHWSDRSTRDLLAFLVRNLRASPVLLLLTYRSDELHRRHSLLPFLAELGRTDAVERLELERFDQRELAEQLRSIAGRDLDDALVERIHARSGGNAFFAEELLVAAGEDGRVELPATLRDALLARVAELAEPTQEVLRVASAAGQHVDPGLVGAAAAVDQAALYDALREAVGRQILVAEGSTADERYAFRHSLLQEAVYDDLLPGERTRLHSTFARTLEATPDPGGHAAELAYHWAAAFELPRALQWSVAAGLRAEAAYAFPEAVAHYERAVELWDRVPDAAERAGRDRVDLLAMLAGVARFIDPPRAVTHVREAIRLAEAAGDGVRASLLNERLGRIAWLTGQGRLALEAYEAAVRSIPANPPSTARARALAGLAQILCLGARFDESMALAEEALALARALGARDIEGHALNTRALDRAVALGHVDEAVADLRAALAIANETGILDDIGRAHANLVWLLDTAGRTEEAVEAAGEGIRVSAALGLIRFFGSHLLCGQGDYLFRLGRWDEAERAVNRAAEAGPVGINAILVEELFGRLAVARGRFDEAGERLVPLAERAERAVDVQFVVPVHASLAQLSLWQGRPAEALERLQAALPRIAFTPEVRIGELFALGVRAAADVVEASVIRRAPEEAAAAVEAGDALLAEMRARHADALAKRPELAPLSAAWLHLCEAEATRLRRRPDPAAWAATAVVWEALPVPYTAAYARWREAEGILAGRGDREEAAAALRGAAAVASGLDARPLQAEIAALAARARLALEDEDVVAPVPATPHDPAADLGLTAREREVLALLALGRTNRQIAEALFISQNTAGVHVSNILGKLGVAGRGEAAAVAYRLGLVASSEAAPG